MKPGDFYALGGTLAVDAPSYVPRRADTQLHDALTAGRFAYVLTPRQQGKSSLMNQVARRLRDEGVTVAAIDLSALGFNLDEERWYNGLLAQLGRRLRLDDALVDYAEAHANLSPLQLWHAVLRDVVLEQVQGPVVLFLDEIDILRSLPFSTDELFAAIRACYNARTQDDAYHRLTFCLLGVATPADLIRNPRLTPFNIGVRIELDDFTEDETAQLQFGLGKSEQTDRRLIRRIRHWTGGHPYLTQRLCQAVAADDSALTEKCVDRICARLFLTPEAGLREDNLGYVQQRLLSAPDLSDAAADERRAALLTLYDQALAGRRVADQETSPLVGELKLSGVVRSESGRLVPRNRIYAAVFDRRWVREHLPDAERRRQRAAFRRGVVRTSLVAAAILAVQAFLGLTAFVQYRRAESERKGREQVTYHLGVNLAQAALAQNNDRAAFLALEALRPRPGETDLRKFEWRYLWGQSQQDERVIPCPDLNVFTLAVSPDGRYVAAGGQAKQGESSRVHLWETATWRELPSLPFPGEVRSVAFASNGEVLAVGGGVSYDPKSPGTLELWRFKTGTKIATTRIEAGSVRSVAFVAGDDRPFFGATEQVGLWDPDTGRIRNGRALHSIGAIAVHPTTKSVAIGYWTGIARLGALGDSTITNPVNALAFSPDGHWFAAEWAVDIKGTDEEVILGDAERLRIARRLPHRERCFALAFSPDSQALAAACWDGVVRLWDVRSGKLLAERRGHVSLPNAVAFLDGRTLITAANDGTLRLWQREVPPSRVTVGAPVRRMTFTDDGAAVAVAGSDGNARLFDVATGSPRGKIRYDVLPVGHLLSQSRTHGVAHFLLSPDGVALSPDRERATAFGQDTDRRLGDGTLEVWQRQGEGWRWQGSVRGAHANNILVTAFSADGKVIATGGWDRAVRFWDAARVYGEPSPKVVALGTISGFSGPVWAVAFSRDGKTLAVGTENGDIYLCDRERREIILTFPRAHAKTVTHLAFSRGDDLLVSGSLDGTVRFWRAASWARVNDPEHVALGKRMR